jgi:hypothetical protein
MDKARSYLERPVTTQPSEQEEVKALISQASSYVDEFPDMPFSDNILLFCARMRCVVGEKSKAIQTLERVINEHGDSDGKLTAIRYLTDWQRPDPGG